MAPLRALRAERPGLLFDCGDSLRGSQTVFHPREPMIAEIDAAGYDLQGMGNREFHYMYAAVRQRLHAMRHPVVCANLIDTKGRQLPFSPYIDLEVETPGRLWQIRAFGLLVVQYPEGSPWERVFGWRFLDPIRAAASIAASTPPGRVLVALSHVGLRLDRVLAAAVPRLDLILGGHSHDTLERPEVVGGVPIVHAGPYGRFVSCTELVPDGERVRIESFRLIPLLAAA